jgi:prolyl-tRNA synthetase
MSLLRPQDPLLSRPSSKTEPIEQSPFICSREFLWQEGHTAPSHYLGQHFSKMFNITVEDPAAKEAGESKHIYIWRNSWGLTTRSIGVMALTHGDNRGLVIPPCVAEIHVIIIPVGVTAKTTSEEKEKLHNEIDALAEVLRSANVRVETDMREGYSPGWKFNDWNSRVSRYA